MKIWCGDTTFLSTTSGKRVYAVAYDPPGNDGLGAKYYFPRTMADGRPFITEVDREVRFETTLTVTTPYVPNPFLEPATPEPLKRRSEKIFLTFDLRKMMIEGKTEI